MSKKDQDVSQNQRSLKKEKQRRHSDRQKELPKCRGIVFSRQYFVKENEKTANFLELFQFTLKASDFCNSRAAAA